METLLWVLQAVLAAIFVITGLMKLTQPRERLAAGMMSWAAHVTDAQFRAIGLLELFGAAGLVLPGVLGVAEVLTPLAATGLALTMIGAVATHLRMGEPERLVAPVVLFVVAVFLAVERFGPQAL